MRASSPADRSHARVARVAARLAAVLAVSASAPAAAEVVLAPWGGNVVVVGTQAKAGPVEDSDTMTSPGPALWSATPTSLASDPATNAFGSAAMILQTAFSNTSFECVSAAVGHTNGSGGTTRCGALASAWFVVEQTQALASVVDLVLGTYGSAKSLAFVANFMNRDLVMVNLIAGEGATQVNTRLSPGTYLFYYQNSYPDESDDGTSNQLTANVSFADVEAPLIQQHPASQSVPAGSSPTMSVGASGLAAPGNHALALTYQWRRDFEPLSDGGRVSGAHTAQLHLTSVVAADSGVYDCVVTQGTIEEPSSAAKLTVTGGITAVGPPTATSLELAAPAPNPFRASTRVQFSLARAAEVSLDVLDVSGRRVQTLLRDAPHAAGPGSAIWDGRDANDQALPAGLYFLRLQAAGEQRVRRVVLETR